LAKCAFGREGKKREALMERKNHRKKQKQVASK